MRGLIRTRETQEVQRVIEPQAEHLEIKQMQDLESIMLSYIELPNNQITPLHLEHFVAARRVLINAYETYSNGIYGLICEENISDTRFNMVSNDFFDVAKAATYLNFPTREVLKPLSTEFFDLALNYQQPLTPYQRQAAATLGLSIGNDSVNDEKVQYLLGRYEKTLAASRRKRTPAQQAVLDDTSSLLFALKKEIEIENIPSVATLIKEYSVKHKKTITTAGTAAVMSLVMMTPTAAAAAEKPNNSVTAPTPSTAETNKSGFHVGAPELSEETAKIKSSALSTEAAAPVNDKKMIVGVGAAGDTDLKQAPIASTPAPEAVMNNVSVKVPDTLNTEVGAAKQPNVEAVPLAPEAKPNTAITPDNVGVPKAPEPVAGVEAPSLKTDPIAAVIEKKAEAPLIDEKTATQKQRVIQKIADKINTDGDTKAAISLMLLNFHDKNVISPNEAAGEPSNGITNPDLIKNIKDLKAAYIGVISPHGHADINYVNTGLLALSTFEAVANDQSILSSPDLQQLLTAVRRPDDPYQGKLFDQYVAKAKEAFVANPALMANIVEEYKPQLETMYAYILMANVSDTDQTTQIDAIKKAEADAAAAAAKAASNYNPTEVEAIAADPNRLLLGAIDRAATAFGWPEPKHILMKQFVAAGAPLGAAAGPTANAMAESGYKPGQEERTARLDKGYGLFQWTFDRRNTLNNAAKAAGVSAADPTFQAGHAIWESQRRGQRDNRKLNEWAGLIAITDPAEAASFWRWNFERPDERVSHADVRVSEAQLIFDQVNGQIEAIKVDANTAKTAREAAAAAAAAEAARIAEEAKRAGRPDLAVDAGRGYRLANNVDYSARLCDPRTIDNGVYKNEAYGFVVRVCEISMNTPKGLNLRGWKDDAGTSVSSLISTNVMNMFEAAAADGINLGLSNGMRKHSGNVGYSNHKFGLALDLGSPRGGISICFQEDGWGSYEAAIKACQNIGGQQYAAYQWLNAHAAEYGFYNLGNEPWHWDTQDRGDDRR